MDVVHVYFEREILDKKMLIPLLDQHAHILFHKYISTTPCCQCVQLSSAAPGKNNPLTRAQFEVLYDCNGDVQQDHEKKINGNVVKHCLCKISPKSSVSVLDMDIILICTITQVCFERHSYPGNPQRLEEIKIVRNYISHIGESTFLSENDFNDKWKRLELLVLDISRLTGPSYENSVKKRILSLEEQHMKMDNFTDEITMCNEISENKILEALRNHGVKIDNLSLQIKKAEFCPTDDSMIESADSKKPRLEELEEDQSNPCSKESRCCVTWKFATQGHWDVKEMVKKLSNLSSLLDFKVEFVYEGSLVVRTSAAIDLLYDGKKLTSALSKFVQRLLEECEIDFTVKDEVEVDIIIEYYRGNDKEYISVSCPTCEEKESRLKEKEAELTRLKNDLNFQLEREHDKAKFEMTLKSLSSLNLAKILSLVEPLGDFVSKLKRRLVTTFTKGSFSEYRSIQSLFTATADVDKSLESTEHEEQNDPASRAKHDLVVRRWMDGSALKVFISHSNKNRDRVLVFDEVIPKLERQNIRIYGQSELIPGQPVLTSITKLVEETERQLLFISKNALESAWCSFEMLISLERAQRTNRLSVVLLLHDVLESEILPIAVLQEAPKIYFTEGSDSWVLPAVEALKENKSLTQDVMPAGNVAHGLVWSHFCGYQKYVLPVLKDQVEASDWYKSQSEDVLSRLSLKLYEIVPRSCTVQHNLPAADENIKEVTTIKTHSNGVMRGGNFRVYFVKIYSVTDGQETYYCMCEFPNVIGTMKVLEENHLAHIFRVDDTGVTAAAFTADDKKLQLGRFYYTMNSVLSHFDNCRDTARVLLYNDEWQKISEVLIEAIKDDLPMTKKPKDGNLRPKLENLESTDELYYEHQVFIAHTETDKEKASAISTYLNDNGVDSILNDKAFEESDEFKWANKLLYIEEKCRWFVILLTKNFLEDKILTFITLFMLENSIDRRKVRMITIGDRKEELYMPEALRWVPYIPFDESDNRYHLKSLHSIVSGNDIPMETQLLLPAGDVAFGLAWGYVTNYLMKILPEILDEGIMPAFEAKKCDSFRCPHKLYLFIPKSCDAGAILQDKTGGVDRISNFTKTGAIFPFGPTRAFHCNIYKVASNSSETGLYFVGHYAAPISCLNEMRKWNIAGVTSGTMASEAFRFYEIVTRLMEHAVPLKSGFCEFVFFDDLTQSLAEIMEEKIRSVDVQFINQ